MPRSVMLALLVPAYVLAGRIGLLLAFANENASPVWAPTGLAIAALLIVGIRAWPAVALGAFIVNLINSGSIPAAMVIAVGNTLHALVPWITRGLLLGRLIVPDLPWVWTVVAVILFIYLMVNALFVGPVGAAANTVSARPISSFLLGLLVLVLMVPAIAILAATVIGIAIVPFVLCAIVVAGLVGKVGVIRAIGRAVWPEGEDDSRVQSFRSVILGFAVLTVAYMIPAVGLITWAITGVIGLGGATAAFRAAMRRNLPACTGGGKGLDVDLRVAGFLRHVRQPPAVGRELRLPGLGGLAGANAPGLLT